MASIEIFQGDEFSVTTLTAAINELPFKPHMIGSMGLFSEEGITTVTAQIEYDGTTLGLVSAKPRGGVADPTTLEGRRLLPFNTVHLPQRSTMMADEIQGIRAFGSASETEVAQSRIKKYLQKHKAQLDLTHEWQRVGAINGKVHDADGKTVLLDIYKAFGITPTTLKMELDKETTIVRSKCEEVVDLIADALGGVPVLGARAICGKNFWKMLTNHKSVRETYLNTQQAAELRGKVANEFEHGGVIFSRYRGSLNGKPYVADDEARAFPEGVDDSFLTRYAPGDYMETVNTEGLPYYSKIEPLPFGKGVQIESQSNPLHLAARPKAIIHLKMGS